MNTNSDKSAHQFIYKGSARNRKKKIKKIELWVVAAAAHFWVSLCVSAPKVQPALVVPISHAVWVHNLCAQKHFNMYFRYRKKTKTAKLGVALKTYKEKKKKKGFNYSEEEDTGIMTGLLALGPPT